MMLMMQCTMLLLLLLFVILVENVLWQNVIQFNPFVGNFIRCINKQRQRTL